MQNLVLSRPWKVMNSRMMEVLLVIAANDSVATRNVTLDRTKAFDRLEYGRSVEAAMILKRCLEVRGSKMVGMRRESERNPLSSCAYDTPMSLSGLWINVWFATGWMDACTTQVALWWHNTSSSLHL
jgi:hypothetical protein